jgi:hypothetical protein
MHCPPTNQTPSKSVAEQRDQANGKDRQDRHLFGAVTRHHAPPLRRQRTYKCDQSHARAGEHERPEKDGEDGCDKSHNKDDTETVATGQ